MRVWSLLTSLRPSEGGTDEVRKQPIRSMLSQFHHAI